MMMLLLLLTTTFGHLAVAEEFMSSCDDRDSHWNRKGVERELKNWIKSIKVVQTNSMESQQYTRIGFFDPEEKKLLKFVTSKSGRYHWLSTGEDYGDVLASHFLNGFLYGGNFDSEGQISGDNASFVFPDMKSVMHGSFRNGVMVSAQESVIVAERCHDGIKEIKVRHPHKNSPVLRYERPTDIQHSGPENVMDPLEKRTVYIKDTLIGHGMFAKRDIADGDLVAYYGGLIQNSTEKPFNIYSNMTDKQVVDFQANLLSLHDGLVVDVPKAELWEYRATLGHKVNHGFGDRLNGRFIHLFHPRQGRIKGIEAIRDISKGEEVLVNYGYWIGDKVALQWFNDAYRREVGKLPEEIAKWYEEKWGPLPQ